MRKAKVGGDESSQQGEQTRQRRTMKRSEMTRELINEKRGDIKSQHIEKVRISQLFMQTSPFADKQHTRAKDQC